MAALLLVLLLLLRSTSVSAEEGSKRVHQCWTARELTGQPGEGKIFQNVRRAFVPLPTGSLPSTPISQTGVLRRVDLPPGVKKIALTFDLCEQPNEVAGYDSGIVDYLRSTRTKATFFAGGKWIRTHDSRARQLIADPLFEIGNHTWGHRNLRLLKGEALRDEIRGAQQAYARAYRQVVRDRCVVPEEARGTANGGQPTLFRFPFGACNFESLRSVADAGMLAIQWDVSSGDSIWTLTGPRMADAVLRSVRPGSIVLFHANGRGWHTADALRIVIPKLRAEGYELVTVSELINSDGARPLVTKICYNNRPGDTDQYDEFARRLESGYNAFNLRYSTSPDSVGTEGENPFVPKPVPATRPKHRPPTVWPF